MGVNEPHQGLRFDGHGLREVRVGGSEQWIHVRGADARNPVVLFLHGGPGTSQLTANARNTGALEDAFMLVDWDQRGAGKSYAAGLLPGSMTIEQFVADTLELTQQLLGWFDQPRLVLVGHSWGSAIGALAVAARPDLFSCYVGIGQVSSMIEGEAISYRWTLQEARRRRDRRAIRALERIGAPPFQGDLRKSTITQRRYLARFGGEVHGRRTGAMGLVLRSLVFSREYTLRDRANYFPGIFNSMERLWPELLTVNLFEQVPRLAVPVFFMEGRHDWEVPAVLSARYYEALHAPAKQLVWFERSGHLPNSEERELFNERLRRDVRPVALAP
jgi:pimeloyl-ACP methyl ester carboxylesterase